MDSAEVIPRHIERNSMFQVLHFPAVSIGQTSEAAKLHSQREVGALHKRRADVLRVGITLAHLGYNLRDWAWGVPLIPELAVISKQLGQLRVVNVSSKTLFDCFPVEDIGIGCELEPANRPIAQVADKGLRILAGTLSNEESCYQLRVGIEGDKHPLVAQFGGFAFRDMPRFLPHKGPDFIALDTAAGKAAHGGVHHVCASRASRFKQ